MEEKNKIARLAIEKVEKNTPFKALWIPADEKENKDVNDTFCLAIGNRKYIFYAAVYDSFNIHDLRQLESVAKNHKHFVVIANKILAAIRSLLREKQIAYIDNTGKVFFHRNRVYIMLDNIKPSKTKKVVLNTAFSPIGLKAIFSFLIDDSILNRKVRDASDAIKIPRTSLNKTIISLRDNEYLFKEHHGKYIYANKRTLTERWAKEFNRQLKPKLLLGTFRFLNENDRENWKALQLQPKQACWSGEPALCLANLQDAPQTFTLYTTTTAEELTRQYPIAQDKKGYISIYQKFWYTEKEETTIAHPALVYADIVNSPAHKEIAKKIREWKEWV
ncbi:MAG: hypothetical protein EBX41_09025 [Chitinophagia bacterium]|nr:hypothetical protein [Chitinophagia bacterium]